MEVHHDKEVLPVKTRWRSLPIGDITATKVTAGFGVYCTNAETGHERENGVFNGAGKKQN